MIKNITIILLIFFSSCKNKVETTKPTVGPITESIYASGILKSKNQYQVFSTVNGIISYFFVTEGDSVKKGSPIVSISDETQKLNSQNAKLAASFSDINSNQGKINEAKLNVDFLMGKMKNDSAIFFRQKNLWEKQIGTKIELEQRELNYQNSKNLYISSIVKYNDLKRQLEFTSLQSKNNLLISTKLENDYTVKSEIDGIVYGISKVKGEIVGLQTPIATIGDPNNFILEMQVDEYDIIKIKKGLHVIVALDSYKEKTFDAIITKINPLMNERSKTFLVEAEFTQQPNVIYPNISFEANIVIRSKEKSLLIPRDFTINDSIVIKSNGEKIVVKTGLKDYKKIEIISGLDTTDELIKPSE